MAAYEATLQLLPEDIHALNNLAWLYATCENEHLRRPRRALILARKAARRTEAPHILDTLAEAYFVNGQWEEAVAAARNTLLLAKDNREYYQSQLERFESYLTSRPSQLSVD
jgi:tetratricopeptide (TPR) repeat protein